MGMPRKGRVDGEQSNTGGVPVMGAEPTQWAWPHPGEPVSGNRKLFPSPTHVHHKMFDSCLQNPEGALIGRAQRSTVGIAANENIVG